MTAVKYTKDSDNIVTLTLDNPGVSANIMNADFRAGMVAAVEKIVAEKDDIAGIIIASAKKTFFAGGDLKEIIAVQAEHAEEFSRMAAEQITTPLRTLETLGKPIVAAINGAALGGGFEICLACHHRIVINSAKIQLGLPEVKLGLLPGGGGVVRMTRLLGIEGALPYLAEGKLLRPADALEAGLVDALADDAEQMLEMAKAFIKSNPKSVQPYDKKGYRMPGGKPSHPSMAMKLAVAPAILRQTTKGVYPAPEAIMAAAVEGAQVDFETAQRIESRYFLSLVLNPVSKSMISTFWFQMNEIKAGASRPQGVERNKFKKVGVLGAGMMGAGIAYSCMNKGIEVVLKDISQASADKGKAYSENLLAKKLKRGFIDKDQMQAALALITATDNADDLKDCDMIVEAVFEDQALKAGVTQEAEAQMLSTGVFASNTSTLPITGLSKASVRPEQFIGLHFFSPVDKMPLVEIIVGEQTSDETLARSYDFVQQIGKTPIVVNDSRGFFTSRVFSTFIMEGLAMLGEGQPAAAIERAATLSGMPTGPLAILDEVTLVLPMKVAKQTQLALEAEGEVYNEHAGFKVIHKMVEEFDRCGKSYGKGFYEYPDASDKRAKKKLWSGLSAFDSGAEMLDFQDMKDRLVYIQSIETVRCMQEGVLTSSRDANIGSIMGIGFAPHTGGAIQYINMIGLDAFIARAKQLEEQYGERFAVPQLLLDTAAKGEQF